MKGTLRFVVTLRRSSVIVGLRSQSLRARSCRAVSWPQIGESQGRQGRGRGREATERSRGQIDHFRERYKARQEDRGRLACVPTATPIWRGARIVDVSRAPHGRPPRCCSAASSTQVGKLHWACGHSPFEGRSNRRRFARPSRRSSQVLLCCFLHTGRQAPLGLRPLPFRGALESSTFRAPLTEVLPGAALLLPPHRSASSTGPAATPLSRGARIVDVSRAPHRGAALLLPPLPPPWIALGIGLG